MAEAVSFELAVCLLDATLPFIPTVHGKLILKVVVHTSTFTRPIISNKNAA